MKQREIQKCLLCGKGIMHAGDTTFYRIQVEQMVINFSAVQRQHGLEQFLNSAQLANVMGPDENLANSVGDPVGGFICQHCAIFEDSGIAETYERMNTSLGHEGGR